MPSHRLATILATALAPCLWGTTYIVFTQTLPVSHPLLVGALRALPAGILLMLLGPGLPPRDKLGRLALVGPLVLYPLWSWRQQEAALRFLR
ncbi:hypothetical protein ACQCSI_18235, partial [Ralstonia pseudosolanacearum]